MKQKLILEIEAPDHLRGLPSMEEIKRAISRGFYEYFGNWVAQNIEINLSSAEVKPLISNVLPLKMVTLHHTEDKGFYCMEDERALDYLEIAKTNKPIDFKSIPWDKDRDNPYREQG